MPMPMQQQAMHPQYVPLQRGMQNTNDAGVRRSRKPADKNMPDGIEDVTIGEGVQQYKSLHDLEKRLDAAIVRKRLDIQDSISRTADKYRTMRIWISNSVDNQPWQEGSAAAGEDQDGAAATSNPGSASYRVKIEGRLLEEEGDGDAMGLDDGIEEDGGNEEGSGRAEGDAMGQDGAGEDGEKAKKDSASKRSKQRFSHFFKGVTIDFDKSSAAPPEEIRPITWTKPQLPPNVASLPPSADFDSLQFSRSSQENLNVTINLARDETMERFKLSKELAEVLDVEEETRSGIVLGLWDYIRAMGLQADEEKRLVRCDHRLKKVCLPLHPPLLFPDILTERLLDLRPRPNLLPPNPRHRRPAHQPDGPDQTTVHSPCRRRLPPRPDAHRL
jgi:SWI/SNF-related matrix-associated actin-dependent regulator of chromatin subfamily D